MSRRPKRKMAKPDRRGFAVDGIPDSIDNDRDCLFPENEMPKNFCERSNDSIRRELWNSVRHIAWHHLLNTYRMRNAATGKQITGELNTLAETAERAAILFENIDIDTKAALLPHIPKPDELSPDFLGGGVRLVTLVRELRAFANYCDTAKEGRKKNRLHTATQLQQNTINQFAEEWSGLIGRPKKSINGEFYHACRFIGERLRFTVSERIIRKAIDNLTDIKGE